MGRLVLAGALVLGWVATATAAPKRKVAIETEPPGASVYLDDVESGSLCKTPCTIDAPIGTSILILRLDKHEAEFIELDVKKGKGAQKESYKLKGAVATLTVETPKGATVRVDEEDQGKAPLTINVTSGEGHYVQVTLNGKTYYDGFIDLQTGEEKVLRLKGGATTVADTTVTDDDDDDDDDDGGGGGGGGSSSTSSSGEISGSADAGPRKTYITGGIVGDIGFRSFLYEGKQAGVGLRDLDSEDGQFIMGPSIEVWPGRIAGVKLLTGMSLYIRAQFPISGPTVFDPNGDLQGTVQTQWSSYEFSLRQRWTFGSFAVEAGAGYVQDKFTYDASDGDLMKMPAARYSSIRIGGKLAYATPMIEPYFSAENRVVTTSEHIDARLSQSDVNGLRASLGLLVKLGKLSGRVEGTLQTYTWTFSPTTTGMDPPASGAKDSIQLLSFLVGYSY